MKDTQRAEEQFPVDHKENAEQQGPEDQAEALFDREAQKAKAEISVSECQAKLDGVKLEMAFFEVQGETPEDVEADFLTAEAALKEAEAALAALFETPNVAKETGVEKETGLSTMDILGAAQADSDGRPRFNYQELLSGKGDGYTESVGKLLAEVDTDTKGMTASLKEKISGLPEMWGNLNASLQKLEDSFKAQFGVTIKEAMFAKGPLNPHSPEEIAAVPAMVKFIESNPATAEFAQASKKIADLNQEKLKLGLAQLAKDKEVSPGDVKREFVNYAADKALGEASYEPQGTYDAAKPLEKKPRSTTQTIDDAGLSLRQMYSYVGKAVSGNKVV